MAQHRYCILVRRPGGLFEFGRVPSDEEWLEIIGGGEFDVTPLDRDPESDRPRDLVKPYYIAVLEVVGDYDAALRGPRHARDERSTMDAVVPLISKVTLGVNTPPVDEWQLFRKTALTHAVRMVGPFRVETSESENEPFFCEDGWLAVDARGYPYAIADDEFLQIYVPAGVETCAQEKIGREHSEDESAAIAALRRLLESDNEGIALEAASKLLGY